MKLEQTKISFINILDEEKKNTKYNFEKKTKKGKNGLQTMNGLKDKTKKNWTKWTLSFISYKVLKMKYSLYFNWIRIIPHRKEQQQKLKVWINLIFISKLIWMLKTIELEI